MSIISVGRNNLIITSFAIVRGGNYLWCAR